MYEVLERLREDHKNLSYLLDILEEQLAAIREGESPDYEILESAIEYCLNYPDLKHHPVEDLILQRLHRSGTNLDDAVFNLAEEHESLGALTRRLAGAVQGVLQDTEIPRDAFVSIFESFLKFYRDHIKKEEAYFFPSAAAHLSPADWEEISQACNLSGDPLLEESNDDHFKELRERVVSWSVQNHKTPA